MSKLDTPARSRPNSRVARSGRRNWLTEDQARARTTPTANIVQSVGDMRSAWWAAGARDPGPSGAGRPSGKRRRMIGAAARISSRGDEAISNAMPQPQWPGSTPTRPSPPSTPIMAENSNTFRRTEAPGPRSSWSRAMSPPTVPRVYAKPRISRPSTSRGNVPETARSTVPASMSAGEAHSVVPR